MSSLYKRWYDSNATLSMAISLLQNTALDSRAQVVKYVNDTVASIDYTAPQKMAQQKYNGLLNFVQMRQSMDDDSWEMIESIRFLKPAEQEHVALMMIRYIYYLENFNNMPLEQFVPEPELKQA